MTKSDFLRDMFISFVKALLQCSCNLYTHRTQSQGVHGSSQSYYDLESRRLSRILQETSSYLSNKHLQLTSAMSSHMHMDNRARDRARALLSVGIGMRLQRIFASIFVTNGAS